MTKLEELKQLCNEAFSTLTEREQIEKSALVINKLTEVENEVKQSQDDYTKLLGDYKDVVLHSAGTNKNVPGGTEPKTFDGDAEFNKLFN